MILSSIYQIPHETQKCKDLSLRVLNEIIVNKIAEVSSVAFNVIIACHLVNFLIDLLNLNKELFDNVRFALYTFNILKITKFKFSKQEIHDI